LLKSPEVIEFLSFYFFILRFPFLFLLQNRLTKSNSIKLKKVKKGEKKGEKRWKKSEKKEKISNTKTVLYRNSTLL